MSDEPKKPDVKRIGWLSGLPSPVAIVAVIWGTVAGLACVFSIDFLGIPYTLAVSVISGAVGGIILGLCLRRWPPSGLKSRRA
jgi:hypothetical protein